MDAAPNIKITCRCFVHRDRAAKETSQTEIRSRGRVSPYDHLTTTAVTDWLSDSPLCGRKKSAPGLDSHFLTPSRVFLEPGFTKITNVHRRISKSLWIYRFFFFHTHESSLISK